MVEVLAYGVARHEITAVTEGVLSCFAREEAVVHHHVGLVCAAVLPTVFLAWGIIGVDVEFVQVVELVLFAAYGFRLVGDGYSHG